MEKNKTDRKQKKNCDGGAKLIVKARDHGQHAMCGDRGATTVRASVDWGVRACVNVLFIDARVVAERRGGAEKGNAEGWRGIRREERRGSCAGGLSNEDVPVPRVVRPVLLSHPTQSH